MKTILITGGAGFIGSHVVRRFVRKYPQYKIINLDNLTYAGNLANLKDIENQPNYEFLKADIVDTESMNAVFQKYPVDGVIHLAARVSCRPFNQQPDGIHLYQYCWHSQPTECSSSFLERIHGGKKVLSYLNR